MHRGREFSLFLGLLDQSEMLLRFQVVESARTSRIHHHAIELGFRVLTVQSDSLVLKVLGIFANFIWNRLSGGCLGSLAIVVIWASFFALSAHDSGQFDLFMFQHMSENDSSHVGVVSSLMIVRKQGLTLVIAAMVLCVKFTAQISLKFVIIDAFFVHLTQTCIVEGLRVVR